jgi:hypothetical protein
MDFDLTLVDSFVLVCEWHVQNKKIMKATDVDLSIKNSFSFFI